MQGWELNKDKMREGAQLRCGKFCCSISIVMKVNHMNWEHQEAAFSNVPGVLMIKTEANTATYCSLILQNFKGSK